TCAARSQKNPQSSRPPVIPIDALPQSPRSTAAHHRGPHRRIQAEAAAPRPHPGRGRRGRIPIEGPPPSSPPVTATSIHTRHRLYRAVSPFSREHHRLSSPELQPSGGISFPSSVAAAHRPKLLLDLLHRAPPSEACLIRLASPSSAIRPLRRVSAEARQADADSTPCLYRAARRQRDL
ncbi:Os04g0355401, partial [Oryza sativa Japonica Group]